MGKKLLISCLVVVFLNLVSCINVKQNIQGIWTVLNITHKGESLMGKVYASNVIFIKEKNEITLPSSYSYYQFGDQNEGKWGLLNDETLNVSCGDSFLNNTYQIKFYQGTKNTQYLILTSPRTEISCVKFRLQ